MAESSDTIASASRSSFSSIRSNLFALVAMARAEEKITALQDDHDKMYERLNRLSQKIDDISTKVDENSRTVQFIHRLFWICIVAIAGAVATNMWMS